MDKSVHALGLTELIAQLETDPERGLSAQEAARRLERHGENRLREAARPPLLLRVLGQLKDPMILVLLAAAALSLLMGAPEDWLDAAIILVIVVVNTVLSLSQEDNAQKALEALRQLTAPHTRTLRDGTEHLLESAKLVPGDVIVLEAGDYVPADGRILWEAGLQTDESAMTGESLPVRKRAGGGLAELTPLAERRNMVIGGTVVLAGRARVAVTATGMSSEMGRIAGLLLGQQQGDTPLQRKMAEVSRTLSLVCVGVCAVMFGIGTLQHRDMLDLFLTAVALAVAAIPEGLPAIVTIVLALGVGRMARRNAIVKRLPAVETLGCAQVICSDKTGTLTQNRMTVREVWTPGRAQEARALTLGTLCSDVRPAPEGFTGDPTEVAIAARAAQEGLHKDALERDQPRRGEVPFDAVRKRMSTCHALFGGTHLIAVKGAPESVLARCTAVLGPDGPVPLTEGQRRGIREMDARLAGKALRVLAVAERRQRERPKHFAADELERDLVFVGLIGMIDPPRPEVRDAVDRCTAAGIRPVMITGDHRETAVAIARELGILRPGDRAIDGAGLDLLDQETLERDIGTWSVFARVTPEHKLRIVRAWQQRGHVVAMTGDGVNDAPALRSADIGCAMGRAGTDVAKGAADMILTDDDFSTIVAAVEQGRGIYANVCKAIHYLLSCNIGEILAIFLATVLAFPHAPLTAVQLLWLNLVTDSLPALALGLEPVEPTAMERPPRRRNEALFTRAFSLRLVWQGALVGGLTLLAYGLGLRAGDPAAANTMAFATLTFSQLFHAYDVRSEETSLWALGPLSNRAMNKAFLVGMALQLAVLLVPPLQGAFSVVPLTAGQWGMVAVLAIAPLVICETVKAVRRAGARRRQKEAQRARAHAVRG